MLAKFKIKDGLGRAKSDYLAYEEIASVIRDCEPCRKRAHLLLDAMTCAALGLHGGCDALVVDMEKSTSATTVIRLEP